MLAYHGKEELKQSVVTEMAAHREADRLVQNYGYWKDGKGCAVGCLLKSGNHVEYESRFGIPQALAKLEDRIFEGLPLENSKEWPVRFLSAIRPGADLSGVVDELMYWLLNDKESIRKYAKPKTLTIIERVSALFKRKISGDKPSIEEWIAAKKAADAAAYAAYADDAAAAYAANAAAAAAAYAAANAAAAAAYAAAAYAYAAAAAADAYAAAREQYFIRIADKLIDLLESR